MSEFSLYDDRYIEGRKALCWKGFAAFSQNMSILNS